MSDLDALRTRVAEAFDRVIDATQGFDTTTLETEPAVGAWSARDVAGHLIDWQEEMLRAADHILGGQKPRGHPIKDNQGYNTMRAAVRGTDPWPVTFQDLDVIQARTMTFLDGLSEDQLDTIGPYPWGEVGRLRGLIEEMAGHLNEHGAQLEEWRLRRTGVRIDRERR